MNYKTIEHLIAEFPRSEEYHDAWGRRQALKAEKARVTIELKELNIRKGRIINEPHLVPAQLMVRRKELIKTLYVIDAEIIQLNDIIHKEGQRENGEFIKVMYTVIGDTFGNDYKMQLLYETRRRMNGEPPLNVSLPVTKPVKTFKKECVELYDILLNARKSINEYVRVNEPEVNKADFLMKLQPIKGSIPSVQDLEKLRRQSGF